MSHTGPSHGDSHAQLGSLALGEWKKPWAYLGPYDTKQSGTIMVSKHMVGHRREGGRIAHVLWREADLKTLRW